MKKVDPPGEYLISRLSAVHFRIADGFGPQSTCKGKCLYLVAEPGAVERTVTGYTLASTIAWFRACKVRGFEN